MTSIEESSLRLKPRRNDGFADADRVVRFWWVAIFVVLMVTAWLTHGGLT